MTAFFSFTDILGTTVCVRACGGPWKPKEGIGFPGVGVLDICEPPNVDANLNSGPLEEQQVLIARPFLLLYIRLKHRVTDV